MEERGRDKYCANFSQPIDARPSEKRVMRIEFPMDMPRNKQGRKIYDAPRGLKIQVDLSSFKSSGSGEIIMFGAIE